MLFPGSISISLVFIALQLTQLSPTFGRQEKRWSQVLKRVEYTGTSPQPRAEQKFSEEDFSRRDTNAEEKCKALASSFLPPSNLKINSTFSQYFPFGSTLSIEALTKLYPNGTIPDDVKLDRILDSVGFDVDLKSQAGYGRLNSRASSNGHTGGLPAFCRLGFQVSTSPVTSILSEVWLPLPSDPNAPLAEPDSDFPTNTTAYRIGQDGKFVTAPLYYLTGAYKKVKPAPGSQYPPAPNDVPAPQVIEKDASKNSTNAKASDEKKPPTTSTNQNSTESTKPGIGSITKKKRSPCSSVQSLSGDAILGSNKGWNGRIAVLGHGGQMGFVPVVSMKQYMARYMFVVAGTNLGHYSGTSGVTWVNGTQFSETLIDFGSRANHITLQLAESAIDQFYGASEGVRNPKQNNRVFRYYAGSSVGGARGLSAAQIYPQDFDGIIAGAPALNFMNMNVGQIHTASLHNKSIIGEGFFTRAALYKTIKDVVTRQCDILDGLEDGVISEPSLCRPQLEKELLCGSDTKYGKTNATCLTQAQIDAAYRLYTPTIIDGEQVYPAYWPGLEDSASNFHPSNSKSSGWHQLVVLKQPKLNSSFNQFTDIRLSDLKAGNAADPGGVNAAQTDLSAFVKNGGKLILYHGSCDLVVSPQSTIDYFNSALKDTAAALQVEQSEIAKSMKFYQIFGMRHSRGGIGAIHFGAPSQNDPGHRPYLFESGYDMTLALIAWVEKGIEPHAQIAARYNSKEKFMPPRDVKGGDPDVDLPIPETQQQYTFGLKNTRLLCPYPSKAVYQKGSNADGEEGYKAFQCA